MLRDQPSTVLPEPAGFALPQIWLFTDKRNDRDLEQTILRLPHGSGIIFRHYHLDEQSRRQRFESVRKTARRRGHMVFLAGSPVLARRWRADGVHGRLSLRALNRGLLHSAPVHNAQDRRLAALCTGVVIFLGGMDQRRYRARKNSSSHGWAAIDALS